MRTLLSKIKQYIDLSENDVILIQNLFSKKQIKEGSKILEEGKVCKNLFFVSSGLLRHFINYDGKERTIHFSEEDNFACDYNSFLSGKKSDKTIEAIEDCELFLISYENLQNFYRTINKGERFGRLLIEETFTIAINHIISVHTDTAEQRYSKFISTFKHLSQRIPQFYIASFIGVTPQSLSRIRRRKIIC